MAAVSTEVVKEDPAFITYLLTPDLCDCFFIVGNKDLVSPERIGVVKKMLLAHSVVLRSDMLVREMEQKKDISVNDTYPDTFKNLLSVFNILSKLLYIFIYGYDNTGTMEFDEADNLLYVAEKYQVKSLKARLATRLIKLLTPENICSLLNNPACSQVLELDSAITHILQYETDKVLASPQFLDLSSDALVKIVEQEAMNVSELEVWQAAVRWASHHANPASGEPLRQLLEKPAKHIRVCAINGDSFFRDVITTGILTGEETYMVCLAKGQRTRQDNLEFFSNEVECRTQTSLPVVLPFASTTQGSFSPCKLQIHTKTHSIELLSLKGTGVSTVAFGTLTYKCYCTIKIYLNNSSSTSSQLPKTISVTHQVEYGKDFSIPMTKDGNIIVLQPNSKYHVVISFDDPVTMFSYNNRSPDTHDNEYITVSHYCSLPFKELCFRPLLKGAVDI